VAGVYHCYSYSVVLAEELQGFGWKESVSRQEVLIYPRPTSLIKNTHNNRLALRDSLSLNFRRRLSEKVSAGLGVRAYQSRGIGDATSLNDRDYIQLQSTFLWYLSSPTAGREILFYFGQDDED
jgi:hypothetical protein